MAAKAKQVGGLAQKKIHRMERIHPGIQDRTTRQGRVQQPMS